MLRVASYNVRSLRDDSAALARVVEGMRPDVLCLQEAPRFLLWRRRRNAFARSIGMIVAAGRRRGGLVIFVRPGVEVIHAETHLLRGFFGLERRAMAILVAEVRGGRVAVACVHLDLAAGARLHHAAEIVAHLRRACGRFGARAVLAGDINEQPHQAAWRFLARRFTDCFAAAPSGHGNTFTAADPRKRIDAVFAGRGLSVRSCGGAPVHPDDLAAATDHLPIQAELVFQAKMGEECDRATA